MKNQGSTVLKNLEKVHRKLTGCQACPQMRSRAVHGKAIVTKVMLVGQAPGPHESDRGKPFAHTAGKTLFKWFNEAAQLGEDEIRDRIYISAVARCFPGKALNGAGDREPNSEEIKNCRIHLAAEVAALKPKLILAVGKVAISEVLGLEIFPKGTPLADVVGKKIKATFHGNEVDVIALPHPSGVSRWPQTEPGKTKLREALNLLRKELPRHLG